MVSKDGVNYICVCVYNLPLYRLLYLPVLYIHSVYWRLTVVSLVGELRVGFGVQNMPKEERKGDIIIYFTNEYYYTV